MIGLIALLILCMHFFGLGFWPTLLIVLMWLELLVCVYNSNPYAGEGK